LFLFSEEGLAHVGDLQLKVVKTPTGTTYDGVEYVDPSSIVAISIIRAGDSMLDTFLSIAPEALVGICHQIFLPTAPSFINHFSGKILIQRNEETAEPQYFYSKLPPLAGRKVILLDPMLATG
jgi:uracil phosphoribosyltransferase